MSALPIAVAVSLPVPPGVAPWWFLVFGCLSAVIFGMGKVGFGGGVGILAVPVMIVACDDAELAVGLMLPLLIAADYIGVVAWWRTWQLKPLLLMAPGAAAGIAAGGMCLWWFGELPAGEAILKLCIGLIAGGFVILRVARRRPAATPFRPGLRHGTLAGLILGISSTLAHAAGPVAVMYLLTQQLGKKRFVATSVILFWAVNQAKLVPYGLLGMINTGSLTLGLWLVPAVLLGAGLGKYLNRRLGERNFNGVIYALLALTAAGLAADAIAEIGGG